MSEIIEIMLMYFFNEAFNFFYEAFKNASQRHYLTYIPLKIIHVTLFYQKIPVYCGLLLPLTDMNKQK